MTRVMSLLAGKSFQKVYFFIFCYCILMCDLHYAVVVTTCFYALMLCVVLYIILEVPFSTEKECGDC